MIVKRQCAVVSLGALLVLVLSANVYFVYIIVDDTAPYGSATSHVSGGKSERSRPYTLLSRGEQVAPGFYRNTTMTAAYHIEAKLASLPLKYRTISPRHGRLLQQLLEPMNKSTTVDTSQWAIAAKWVNAREVMPAWAPQLGSMLHTLCSSRILHADNALQGTQLKLILTLAGGQRAIFKPQWYSREAIIQGPVYAGKDRHNAEVAAFHLSLALGLRRCPLTVGRKLNLRRELIPVASDNLLDTFYQEGNNTCFYGVCYYCSPQDPVCAQKDVLEGALIMWLSPGKLKKLRSPWQRTYKAGVAASFGNPHLDHVDILAPLYQCCILRKSTWQRLRQFSGGVLGSTLGALLEHSHISPVLAAAHLRALDRRLMTTFAAVEQCFSRYGRSSVLLS
ncbi:glycosaminoglycan xylosylkinase isoform X2 [Bacillus rossius redtenbacheri]|uniref:glycosaminoglycan xylosylkinase isoform X2 n=1 Tax=Bacillus rossius redtenbacheri TaxID=93214 RepID=UPI002FDCD612